MAGIYMHIPFCRKACHYCNFHFSTQLNHKEALVQAMCVELKSRKDFLLPHKISTIYFGGGTPSLLEEKELMALLEHIHAHYDVDSACEVSLEANPEDLDSIKLAMLRRSGINRLSIGVQSVHDEELIFMNRAHTGDEAIRSIQVAQDAGFDNISVDLMFGLINSTHDMWIENLQKIVNLDIPHLSCYNLTIEEQTALSQWVKKKRVNVKPDEYQRRQYLYADQWLSAQGYQHYEVSNYAKSGYRSRHNANYWQGIPYLGVGPAAHSFKASQRCWNVAHNHKYIQSAHDLSSIQTIESLSETDQYNELIMLRLRTSEGLNKQQLQQFSSDIVAHWARSAYPFIADNILIDNGENYCLSQDQWYMSDSIISELFFV